MKPSRFVRILLVLLAGTHGYASADKPALPPKVADLRSAAQAKPIATVVVLVNPDCPVSNGYVPVLEGLALEFSPQAFFVVAYVCENAEDAKKHRLAYAIKLATLHDGERKLARMLGATHVPEVFVFDQNDVLQYHGRIDDRYARRGGPARTPRQQELRDSLTSVIGRRPVAVAYQAPIGCSLETPTAPSADAKVTYAKDVSRILQKSCQECHRPGGAGPFSLTTYSAARSWAPDIVAFTQSGAMPPWKPVEGSFQHERRLAEADKKTLANWLETGCAKGDDKDLPPPREFPAGWRLGEPDLVLQPAEDYEIAATGRDEYRCFVFATAFDADRYVSAFEVLPGNARVVHHVLGFIDTTGVSAKLDADDPKPGYRSQAGIPGFLPTGGLGGWAPGNGPHVLPQGMVRVLPKGARIVLQVHYHSSGRTEKDRTKLGLYFAKTQPERAVYNLMVMPPRARRGGLVIPAGAKHHEARGSLTLMDDLLGLAITPHMHLLGKDFRMTATFPSGETRTLIDLRNWDFQWQESYQFTQPISLPRGTRLDLVAHFDNSADNPDNPTNPPRQVRWGEQTNDEMLIGFVEVASARKAKSLAEVKPPTVMELIYQRIQSSRINPLTGGP